jgi:hypothetical protein
MSDMKMVITGDKLKAVTMEREPPRSVANNSLETLTCTSLDRALCTFQMSHIQAAIDKTEFLVKIQSLLDADDTEGKAMLSTFTECERKQTSFLLAQVLAARRLDRNIVSTHEHYCSDRPPANR